MRSASFALAAALAASACFGSPIARADGDEKPKTDLIDVLRPTPVGKGLDRLRIRPYGWVEASLTASPLTDGDLRAARSFDAQAEGFQFHQAYVALERTLPAKSCFDVGGKVSAMWGTDARLIHCRGLFDHQDRSVEQFDLLEFYASARAPVADGLTVRLGRFDTIIGYEVIEAPGNPLPSHSFLFSFAGPGTHTGVIATLDASPRWKATYGVVEGWDVWSDNNDALSQLAGVAWTSDPAGDSVNLSAVVGPERDGNDRDLRTVLDLIWTHAWTERLSTTVNADYGFEEGAAPDGGDARWWGIAAYATDTGSDALSATWRVEFFRDEDGTRLGEPASLGEVTFGVDWKPNLCLPTLHLRPEIRWDHSFDGRYFDGGRRENQLSLTLDVLFTF